MIGIAGSANGINKIEIDIGLILLKVHRAAAT